MFLALGVPSKIVEQEMPVSAVDAIIVVVDLSRDFTLISEMITTFSSIALKL
ncbi:hypothetical protein [Pyrococcus furiosus]|uniref:hypothetical protein n=1 Tax=Pyrococcus furiosus TaxID=2261 RepID=UPI000A96F045|nr:hypothetical protein [Pyrococcus furiosus]